MNNLSFVNACSDWFIGINMPRPGAIMGSLTFSWVNKVCLRLNIFVLNHLIGKLAVKLKYLRSCMN